MCWHSNRFIISNQIQRFCRGSPMRALLPDSRVCLQNLLVDYDVGSPTSVAQVDALRYSNREGHNFPMGCCHFAMQQLVNMARMLPVSPAHLPAAFPNCRNLQRFGNKQLVTSQSVVMQTHSSSSYFCLSASKQTSVRQTCFSLRTVHTPATQKLTEFVQLTNCQHLAQTRTFCQL